jgi:RNA-directed DNA polymerase
MATGLERIVELVRTKPKQKLQTLAHLINTDNLKESHKKLDENKATGVDRITKTEYEEKLEGNLMELVKRMKEQSYKPQPARRVFIPKVGSDKLRPLGIPSYEDKLVQDVISQILNVIYEPEFLDHSYGFRPERSCHDAIIALDKVINKHKINYIVDADIKGFFDNVNHEWMMKFLEERIADPNLLRLIKRFLKAGVMVEGKYSETDRGTPQGGLISPILANIYLHYSLDLWFEKVIKKKCKGDAYIMRYADDFVCCFQYKNEAKEFYKELIERLKKFGLEIETSKTKIIEFGRFAESNMAKRGAGRPETFDFLGFTHICSKTRKGKFTVKRITSRKKLKAKRQAVKKWLKENMHMKVKELVKRLNAKLTGHYRYYGVNENIKQLNAFRYYVLEQMRRMLNRRSQRNRYTWEDFERKVLSRFPVKCPKIYVNIYGVKYEQTMLEI